MSKNFIRKEERELYLFDTNVENVFINEYMVAAPGDFVKVYMFALMYANAEQSMSNEAIAKYLSMAPEDVLKAWTYWEKMGIVEKHFENENDPFNYNIEFVSLKELIYSSKARSAKKKSKSTSKSASKKLESEELQTLFKNIEKTMGRLLAPKEPLSIISWIDDFGAKPNIILKAYDYSKNIMKKDSVAYVASVVKGWTEKGFEKDEDVANHIEEIDNKHFLYKRIMKALGFHRSATESEKKHIDSWFNELGYNLDRVLEACEKTSGISNPNINYVNRVLLNWKNEGGSAPGGAQSKEKKDMSVNDVSNYYEYIRQAAQKQGTERRKEIYRTLPEVKEIDEEIRNINRNISKLAVSRTDESKKQILAYRNKAKTLEYEIGFKLTENNFPVDYMDVKYKCEECKDTGLSDGGDRCQCFKARQEETKEWLKTKSM